MDKQLARDFKKVLKEAAEPVKEAAASKISRFAGVGKPRIHVLGKGVFVRQSARTVTGQRGDFGGTQMRST